MKCRECIACYKGFWASQPESYVCLRADKPFVVTDRNMECIVYPKQQYVCTYCDNMDELYGDFSGRGVVDEMHTLWLQTYDRPKFNYCPICGRKLTKEN